MKSANAKTWLAAVSFLLLAAPAGLSFAHTQDGSLGAPTAATDYYQITCSDDGSGVPASMQFQIQNRGPTAAVVSVLVHKGIIATSSSDATAGFGFERCCWEAGRRWGRDDVARWRRGEAGMRSAPSGRSVGHTQGSPATGTLLLRPHGRLARGSGRR